MQSDWKKHEKERPSFEAGMTLINASIENGYKFYKQEVSLDELEESLKEVFINDFKNYKYFFSNYPPIKMFAIYSKYVE